MDRVHVSTGTPWEPIVGYSRLVRVGPFVFVAGTTATDSNGHVTCYGDPYGQTKQALHNIDVALSKAGAKLADIVRTRIYVTDISNWELIGRAHGEVFADIRPSTTMVEISRLVDPDMLVEIEADAIISTDMV